MFCPAAPQKYCRRESQARRPTTASPKDGRNVDDFGRPSAELPLANCRSPRAPGRALCRAGSAPSLLIEHGPRSYRGFLLCRSMQRTARPSRRFPAGWLRLYVLAVGDVLGGCRPSWPRRPGQFWMEKIVRLSTFEAGGEIVAAPLPRCHME